MRALCLIALAACATTPHRSDPTSPLVATYDVDTHTLVPIVYQASHAQHYRVAVIDPHDGTARFVMVPMRGGAPVVVHVAAQNYSPYRFASCIGSCSTSVWVSSRSGSDAAARDLFDAIGERAQAARLDH